MVTGNSLEFIQLIETVNSRPDRILCNWQIHIQSINRRTTLNERRQWKAEKEKTTLTVCTRTLSPIQIQSRILFEVANFFLFKLRSVISATQLLTKTIEMTTTSVLLSAA